MENCARQAETTAVAARKPLRSRTEAAPSLEKIKVTLIGNKEELKKMEGIVVCVCVCVRKLGPASTCCSRPKATNPLCTHRIPRLCQELCPDYGLLKAASVCSATAGPPRVSKHTRDGSLCPSGCSAGFPREPWLCPTSLPKMGRVARERPGLSRRPPPSPTQSRHRGAESGFRAIISQTKFEIIKLVISYLASFDREHTS